MARSPKKLERPGPRAFVIYRSARTNRPRKFNPRVKLYAEVYSKITRKRIGYLNDIKDNKPVGRYFSSKTRRIYHHGRKTKTSREETEANSFVLRYDDFFSSQIPREIPKLLNHEIEMKGFVQFKFSLKGRDNKREQVLILTESHNEVNQLRSNQWIEIIVTLITAALRKNQLRTSPKRFSKSRYWYITKTAQWNYVKRYRVKLIISSF